MASIKLIGYHGSSEANCNTIVSGGTIVPSIGDDHWIGDGVYFFVDGKGLSPLQNAENWAIAQSFDPTTRTLKYLKYGVIQSIIEVEEDVFLDLTTQDGFEVFSYLKTKFVEKVKKEGLTFGYDYWEGKILNFARKEGLMDIEVVKGEFYVKFVEERILRINLRIPNTTMCTVFNPKKNIQLDSVKIIKTGMVK